MCACLPIFAGCSKHTYFFVWQVPRPKLSEEVLDGMYMLGAFAETDIKKGTIVARGTGFFWHKAYPLSMMRRPKKGRMENLEAGVYAVDMPNMYGNDKEFQRHRHQKR